MCWWNPPEQCAIRYDAEIFFRSVIRYDLLVFASPLVAGFPSFEVKKVMGRLVVLLHPYIEVVNGERRYRKRYATYPEIGLLLEREPDSDDEDLSIVSGIFKRFALNFHSNLKFMKTINEVSLQSYQSPYLALKYLPFLSNRIWLENIQVSYLKTQGYKPYYEIGYFVSQIGAVGGVGFFGSFEGKRFHSFSVKASLIIPGID